MLMIKYDVFYWNRVRGIIAVYESRKSGGEFYPEEAFITNVQYNNCVWLLKHAYVPAAVISITGYLLIIGIIIYLTIGTH